MRIVRQSPTHMRLYVMLSRVKICCGLYPPRDIHISKNMCLKNQPSNDDVVFSVGFDCFMTFQVLTENGTGFLVGSSVTIADCALFNILSYIDEGADYGNLLDEFPRCKVRLLYTLSP